MIRKNYRIKGIVQGVGFRPFVYKMAYELDLKGFIKNSSEGVILEIEGKADNLTAFEKALMTQLPPLARIDTIISKEIQILQSRNFEILQSDDNVMTKTALISPDIAICQECLADVKNEGRHHNYFATNCTNCGPRYSIINTLPYDRINTSMAKFVLCESCAQEYTNPLKRRYHAQPISCNSCGPELSLWDNQTQKQIQTQDIYKSVANLIQKGEILAIKGIGGFHIVCDASNDATITKLRQFKNRPAKPFALMCKDLTQIQSIAHVEAKELELLISKEAPIVILKKKANASVILSQNIAPNINKIGCFLAYTSLHHLVFEHLQNPIVATSANLESEPIITNKEMIEAKLPFVAFILDFDREIVNAVDDSLVQVVDANMQTLRLARGYAPKVIQLPFGAEKKILAVGANAKNALAFVMDNNIILSPHIGNVDSLESFGFFERTLDSFKGFYDFEPDIIVHDKHPEYQTTKWAKKQNAALLQVGHHLAHIYACKAEFGLSEDYLGFSFDGIGYGDGETLWGGEIFVGDKRKYTFKTIKLLGGEKAIKEPRRVALSMLFETLRLEEVLVLSLECVAAFSTDEIKILYQSYSKNLNAPKTSSIGRLFDGIISLSGVLQNSSYEGESGLLCESLYDTNSTKCFAYTLQEGVLDIKIVPYILQNAVDKHELNSMLINTLAQIVVDIAIIEKREVILSGGVFQNKTLLELIAKKLKSQNIRYYAQQSTPINDGGIALGQAYYCKMSR
ncbi:MAG TPA: carbamoyltransferase HypF [Sulfurimonas sp. UBA12504]|nr:MAG: carbamoyltransferase HypF [Sulfurimonas sp. GWF2_37_8]DAB28964.1 MAG TPA: carbamoyltransferase HypF [Sulfurimonas sp. UBA12504]